ncbi:MAG: DinB family protein [Cyclobacteriaceae bacterium]|nr:DinB family protein [Cyclobacteriaceae bacterium]MDW8331904.1 DinB family protein [Cyclobacteriaceae bacterium]
MEKEFIDSLITVFDRDLTQLKKEIENYPNEASLWKLCGEIKNPGGNLCLHLCGNLQHFIGHVLGGTDYKRNRDHEFSARNVARSQLLAETEKTRAVVHNTLSHLDHSLLSQPFPTELPMGKVSTTFFLIHLAAHLNYHLGQVNYHRRLIEYGFF